jgi:transcriptional regulator EpsA
MLSKGSDLSALSSKFVILDNVDEERVIRVMESAISIKQEREFFLWTQGQLHSLLPHDIMVCVHFNEANQLVNLELLRGRQMEQKLVDGLCDPVSGLAVRLLHYCRESSDLPHFFEPNTQEKHVNLAGIYADIGNLGVGDVLVHGTEMVVGGSSWFLLFGAKPVNIDRQLYFIQLFLPCLHMLFLRVLSLSKTTNVKQVGGEQILSAREREILHWIAEGKSNAEIGVLLYLSPLTVKNHLQRIYQKLKVRNRAHAVSFYKSLSPTRR